MPLKPKKVHNTRSVSGVRSRSNSPLVVKVNNNLAKAKQAKQAKSKLKSIVKVVNTNASQSTKKVSFCQGPATPVDQQPASQRISPAPLRDHCAACLKKFIIALRALVIRVTWCWGYWA